MCAVKSQLRSLCILDWGQDGNITSDALSRLQKNQENPGPGTRCLHVRHPDLCIYNEAVICTPARTQAKVDLCEMDHGASRQPVRRRDSSEPQAGLTAPPWP